MADDDAWDAFGSDDEEEEEDEVEKDAGSSEIALYLAQHFVRRDAHIQLSHRVVGVLDGTSHLQQHMTQRGIQWIEATSILGDVLDAFVLLDAVNFDLCWDALLPGGLLISPRSFEVSGNSFLEATTVYENSEHSFVARIKKAGRVHASTCQWLSTSHSVANEEVLLEQATVSPSAYEVSQHRLSDHSLKLASQCLTDYGYCIIPKLLDPEESTKWGTALLESVHAASKVLLKDGVDIYNPLNSTSEPKAYRELSMREDLRLDLRHAPPLEALRATEEGGNGPIVVSADQLEVNSFLRGHPSLLEIVRQCMNPQKRDLYTGNLGRFNFGGKGADGSYQDLRLSQVGGIVSFPSCGDQAIHADCPHLFEHIPDLPAHYINIFTPGTPFDEAVGGTAFVHGSHNLEFTAKHCGTTDNYHAVYPYLVRPTMSLGDVVLFDCRVLHFGMANLSESTERVLLYTNTTQAWFHDPKNWDDRQRIFP
eukprot:Nitzschia sp. Nitz4//scaffold59_size112058//83339//84778//NITZ4_004122-RA/size112058-processed-gene-0.200-mRNA-1//1//CDS//3329555162//6633//frame0